MQDDPASSRAQVDFPAFCPFVLACGGTNFQGSGSAIAIETVWNDGNGGATGGELSEVFGVPSYQMGLVLPTPANPQGKPGRGVPDVAGDADPTTGYKIRVDSTNATIGGTSAVAPLWAGLIAHINQGR